MALGTSPGGQLPGTQDSVPILGTAASSVASHPISPSLVSAVSTKLSYATPGHTDGVLVTDSHVHGHRPPNGIANIMALGTSPGGLLPGAQDSVPIIGAAVSSVASYPISPSSVSAVPTKLSFATPGQTDGVLVTDSRVHGHRPPYGIANTMGRFDRLHGLVTPAENDTKDAARDPDAAAHEHKNFFNPYIGHGAASAAGFGWRNSG